MSHDTWLHLNRLSHQQAVAFKTMKGCIVKTVLLQNPSESSRSLPLGMPDLEHPLLDYERYQQWGAFRELSDAALDMINKKPLDMTEVEAFDNHNRNCIVAFRFVVRLLNCGSAFPCSGCQWLRLRMRSLFGNDFYLAHLEGQKNLSVFRPAGGSTGYWDFLKPDFTLKRYYNLSCKAGKEWTSRDSFIGNLSLFMPCVWGMGLKDEVKKQKDDGSESKDEDDTDFGKLKALLKELTDHNGKKHVDYSSFCLKALALYKASCMFVSLCKESTLLCPESCECMKWLWDRFNCAIGECIIPSLMLFPNHMKHYKGFNKELTFRINIAIFLIKLLLCRYEEQSFVEINEIRKYLKKQFKKQLKKQNEEQKGKTVISRPASRIIFSFYKDIAEESKCEMIRLFLRDAGDDIDDEDLLRQIKECEAFSYHSMKSGNRVLFVKDSQNFRLEPRLGDVVHLIIPGRVFYENVKNEAFWDECRRGNAHFLVVFGNTDKQMSPGVAGMVRYIQKELEVQTGLDGKVLILRRKKEKLAEIVDRKIREGVLAGKTEEVRLDAVYPDRWPGFFRRCKECVMKANSKKPICLTTHNGLIVPHDISEVKELSQMLWKEMGDNGEPVLPNHYIKPERQGRGLRQSWFMTFTEKHKAHNLSALTVLSAVLFVLWKEGKIVDEHKIHTLIRDMKKSLRRQWPYIQKVEDKKQQGRILYSNENGYFDLWLSFLYCDLMGLGNKKDLFLAEKKKSKRPRR